jgi:NitT/TauT family transport system substrate-binding protein
MNMLRLMTGFSAVLAWAMLAAAPASAADKVVLMLNWYVYGEHAPFYYGKAKGIYAAENTVAITPADSMTQIWPLFLKKTGLKEADFKTVAGDGQTKLNAVINGQADLLLGYVMDQSMKIKDATGKDVYPIKFADYGINMVSSGMVANTDYVKANADLVKRFMAASTKAVEAAEKDPKGAAQSILDANPKGGKIDTLTQGFELTIPLYRTPETKGKRPFQVTDANMTDSVNLMVEYGGLEAKAKDNPKAFYTNDYLPK